MKYSIFTLLVVLLAFSCREVNEDGDEIRAAMQQVIDAIGHHWQISEVVYSYAGHEDSVVYDVGEIYYDPCRLPRYGVLECSGYY